MPYHERNSREKAPIFKESSEIVSAMEQKIFKLSYNAKVANRKNEREGKKENDLPNELESCSEYSDRER